MSLLDPSPALPGEAPFARRGYALATLVVALALFVAALGAGSPDTPPEDRLPAWVDHAANLASAAVGVGVLVPRARRVAAWLAAGMMALSMATNLSVDGPDFFLRALPFNLTTLALALALARRMGRPGPGRA